MLKSGVGTAGPMSRSVPVPENRRRLGTSCTARGAKSALKAGTADEFQSLLVGLRERHRIELPKGLDFRVVERLEEPMAIICLPSEVLLELLELPLVLGQDEGILVDRRDLLVHAGEGLLGARLLLTQFPDQVRAVCEPFQLACDSRHPFFQSSFVSEGAEGGLPIDVGPQGGDLAVKIVDPVLCLVASLLVFALREVKLPPRCVCGRLTLLVGRLRLLHAVQFLPQAVEVSHLLLEDRSLRLEFGGDLTLVSDLRLPRFEGLEPRRAIFERRGRPHPPLVLRLEFLHLLGADFEGGLELRDSRPSFAAFSIQALELLLQTGKTTERFLAGGDFGVLRLNVTLHRSESFLCPLESLFEDLEPEEFLEDGETLRAARGPELFHLLLTDEGRIPESIVIESDHVADRPLLVRDRALHGLAVPGDFEVRILLRREAACYLPVLVPLTKGHSDVSVRPTHVGEFHALDVGAGRLA